jgi:hypothetical protein
MTDRVTRRHIEIKDGDDAVAAADVATPEKADEAARASLHASSGHIRPGQRAKLVDSVADLPEIQDGRRVEASIPLGDGESLDRFRERFDDVSTRPAGSTALVDATAPEPAAALAPDEAQNE